MTHRTAADEILADLVDADRRHDPGRHIIALQRALQGQGVHDRRQHAHVVAGHPVHAVLCEPGPAEYVPAPDHDGYFNTQLTRLSDFLGQTLEHGRIDAILGLAHEGLAGEFQQYAPEGRPGFVSCVWRRFAHRASLAVASGIRFSGPGPGP
jgi:hypothetical protein